MGLYVNPTTLNKEQWLIAHAEMVTHQDITGSNWTNVINMGRVPLVWVDNGPFTALAVAFSSEEAEEFAQPDGRAKRFFTVRRSCLADYASGVGEHMLRSYNL